MSLWGRLTEMAEKANDAIVDNIAPLLDDSDEEYYSDGEERSFGEDDDSDDLLEDASYYDTDTQGHRDVTDTPSLHLKPSRTCEEGSAILLGEETTSQLENSGPKQLSQSAESLEEAVKASSKLDKTTPN